MKRSAPAASARQARTRERERVERKFWPRLTPIFLKIFNGNAKIFEYESCSRLDSLQLLFQAKLHLRFGLKVKFEFLTIVHTCHIQV